MFKFLLVLALVVAAGWYGWKHYGGLMNGKSGEVVVVNSSGQAVERLRISVGSLTEVVETLENGATARVGFQPQREGTFHLVWKYRGMMGEREWTGGSAPASQVMTHRFEFTDDHGGVDWTSEMKESKRN